MVQSGLCRKLAGHALIHLARQVEQPHAEGTAGNAHPQHFFAARVKGDAHRPPALFPGNIAGLLHNVFLQQLGRNLGDRCLGQPHGLADLRPGAHPVLAEEFQQGRFIHIGDILVVLSHGFIPIAHCYTSTEWFGMEKRTRFCKVRFSVYGLFVGRKNLP